ncbi:MAG TPA: FHA domain-containing protein [Roseiflexaceae bacterium]
MKCPRCGTENDATNRFCEECGARLEPSGAAPEMQAAIASQPTAAAATCPSCGAVVLPGEAFCDECGVSLPGVAPAPGAVSYDAPTVYDPPKSTAAPAEPPTPMAEPPADEKAARADLPTVEQPVLPTDAGYQAEQQRLTEEIARQQQIIAQFEQMQAMFGAAVPAAVTQGLAEARDAKARAEADLAALGDGTALSAAAAPPPVTPPSPAVVAAPPEAPTEPEPIATPPAPVSAAPEPVSAAPEPAVAPPISAPPVAQAEPAPHPRLVLDENGKELPLPIDKAEIIVGREDPISGIFPEIDLTPYGGETGGVSRQHARINHVDGQWTVTDLNSTNYTRVDGNKLDPSLPAPIKDGSRIQFGRIVVTFRE